MSCIEEEISNALASEYREVVWRHRPETRPHFGSIEIGAFRVEFLRHAFHERKIGRAVARVIACKLGGRGDADAVAKSRDGDKIVLVDRGDRRRIWAIADRDRQGISLDRIDRQSRADFARQHRTMRPEREHIGVAPKGAFVGHRLRDFVARRVEFAEPPDGGTEVRMEFDAPKQPSLAGSLVPPPSIP